MLIHNMWVTTELLCRCRLRTYKANEEIRKDELQRPKKGYGMKAEVKELKKGQISITSQHIIWDNSRVEKDDVKRNILYFLLGVLTS
jgi:hypothetical protein